MITHEHSGNRNCDLSFNIESKSIIWLKSCIVTALKVTLAWMQSVQLHCAAAAAV